jgi:putative nucleotidyltransferase with HDIG domain
MDNIIISISIGYETKTMINEPVENTINKAEEQMYMKKLTESKSMRNKTIQAFLSTLRETNERERIHSERVSKISRRIAEAMEFDEETNKEIEYAGLMHDIGKIAINSSILNKPGNLTGSEYQEIKRHAESGYQILRSVDSYTSLAEIALSHHERWDGNGYPRGLKGEEIPLIARIISAADSYEAMTATRPYKSSMSKEEAIEELLKNSGTQFDPKIVNVLVDKVLINFSENY